MGTLEIRLFGTLRVRRPGEPARPFPTRRARDLFAYLLPDCYEEWCLRERERLQQTAQRALGALVEHHESRDEPAEAVACASRLLALDPLREDVHRTLIRLYLGAGQTGAARRQLEACRAVLQRELGVAPAPETAALAALLPDAPPGRVARTRPAPPPNPALASATVPFGHSADGSMPEAVDRLREAVAAAVRAQAELRLAVAAAEVLTRQLRSAPARGGEAAVTGGRAGPPHPHPARRAAPAVAVLG
jgi:hypothetical protein